MSRLRLVCLAALVGAVLATGVVGVGTSGHLSAPARDSALGRNLQSVIEPGGGDGAWFFSQRAFPGRAVPAAAYAAAARRTMAFDRRARASRPARTAQGAQAAQAAQSTWTNIGPAPTSQDALPYSDPVWSNFGGGIFRATGRVTAMAVDPHHANVVYEGAADGGVWKSTDGGLHWRSVSGALPTQAVGAIAIAPSAPSTIYVGTGEANTNGDAYFGYGVFKSTNGGASWNRVGGSTFDQMTVFQIVTRGRGALVFAATNRGLYRSINGGGTWRAVLRPGNPEHFDSFVTGVAWTYQTHRSMIAAVGYRERRSTNGIYRSSNDGRSWRFLGSPRGFDRRSDIGRVALATTPRRRGLTYAAVSSAQLFTNPMAPTVFKGVYKSTHGAAGPWREVESAAQMARNPTSALSVQNNPLYGLYNPGVQAWYDMDVSIDPTNYNDVVVGLEEIWNSRDGGRHWRSIGRYWDFCNARSTAPWCYEGGRPTNPTTHPDQHGVAWGVNRRGRPVLYAGNDGGVWSQVGPRWSNARWRNDNHSQSTTQCYSVSASADGTVICGLQDNGFVKYTGSPTWPAIAGGDGADGVLDPANSQNLIGTAPGMEMYESHNGGQSYLTISPPDPNPRFVAPITIDPTDGSHIATVGQKVWETTKGFTTICAQNSAHTPCNWKESYDLGKGLQGTALSVDGPTLYAGWCGECNPVDFANVGAFHSGIATNQGGTWHAAAAGGLPNRYITSIVQDPADDQHIYVTLSGFSRAWIPGGATGHVFESTDAGQSFTNISGDLPDAPVSAAILSPVGGSLIVGTDTGIFQRQPSGGWLPLGTGFPAVAVVDLTTIPGTDTLAAATHGRGVWELPLS